MCLFELNLDSHCLYTGSDNQLQVNHFAAERRLTEGPRDTSKNIYSFWKLVVPTRYPKFYFCNII